MTDHTPEPQETIKSVISVLRTPAELTITKTTREALAADLPRIVACLDACAGIPTKQLGDVKALVEGLEGMLHFFMGYSDMEAWKKADAALAPFRKG